MSSPRKRPPAEGIAKSKGAAVAGLAFEKAKRALQDEKIQAMLLEQYQSIKTPGPTVARGAAGRRRGCR